ncbi:MAG: nuclear transport factor 2 family protein [Sandaracinaceae bacterium]
MSRRIANATGLYLEGIRDGHLREALDKYTGARYTQHSTGVADGKDGFIAFFEPFLERNPDRDIRVVRAIEDGRFVFCHVHQALNGGAQRWVTADLFDTDDEHKVIEHWDVIQEDVGPASGRTMVSGPTEIDATVATEHSKDVVRRFADEVLLGDGAELKRYVAHDIQQHRPGGADGIDAFAAQVGELEYLAVHRLMGQGDFVVLYSHVRRAEAELAWFDILRLRDGLIVEHWDVAETIGPPDSWNNSGKF